MTADDVELRRLISRRLRAERDSQGADARYWYPLSRVTYGEDEVMQALQSMLTMRTTMGAKTELFELKFAKYAGVEQAVMVNSGSSADLLLSYLLADPEDPILRSGAEVLVPAVTWPTQIWSLLMAGFRVKLVDVDPSTMNVSTDSLEAAIGPDTKAIFLVHLLGNPCDMDAITSVVEAHDLVLLEDCCEALGAKFGGRAVGSFGLGAAFSFFFSHHITTMEGGVAAVNSAELADQLRVLRSHGWYRAARDTQPHVEREDLDPRYLFLNWGMNLRPTEVQAAFGLEQLDKVGAFSEIRSRHAARFNEYIDTTEHLQRPAVHEKATPSWMALPIRLRPNAPFTRTQLTTYLEESGVETRPIVAGNLMRQPAARLFDRLTAPELPGADDVHDRAFYIGLSPTSPPADIDRLVECFGDFLSRY